MNKIKLFFSDRVLKYLVFLLFAIGVLYRVILWWMNRGMYIDEANLARNIYERNFLGLTRPLSYEQFAPPFFLFITKINTILFGSDEKVFRLFALISGVAAIFLFVKIARQFISLKAIWYPLALFATGAIYLRYSTEFKQYSSDAFISLLVVYTATRLSINTAKPILFLMVWILLGSLAIWLSMPSVFILAGVGAYYFAEIIRTKTYKQSYLLIFIVLIWLLQFGYYYFAILQPQSQSNYLQQFHHWYFLDAFPESFNAFKSHNGLLLKGLFEAMSGKLLLSLILNIILYVTGVYYTIKANRNLLFLLFFPIILTLAASALKAYSLMDRLMLFYFPLGLLLLGKGLDFFMQKVNAVVIKIPVILLCVFTVFKFNKISYLTTKPLNLEAVDDCLDFLLTQNITAQNLYIHNLASGGYVYYTEIHPNKTKWKSLANAHFLNWDADYTQLLANEKSAVLTTSMGQDVKEKVWDKIVISNTILATYDKTDAKAMVFEAKK